MKVSTLQKSIYTESKRSAIMLLIGNGNMLLKSIRSIDSLFTEKKAYTMKNRF